MAIINRIKGANWDSSGLPVLNSFVTQGLVAAFRPKSYASSMVDLSGNETHVQTIGNPQFTKSGVIGSNADGFLTSCSETSSHTYIATIKGDSSIGPFIVGNFNSQSAMGTGIVTLAINNMMHNAGAYWTKSGDTTNWDRVTGSGVAPDNFRTAWAFIALTVDSEKEWVELWLKQGDSPLIRAAAVKPSGIKTRNMDATKKIRIMGPTPAWTSSARNEVAETLIYNRALSESEIKQQYLYSQKYHLNNGVVI
ncbi:hypothetical protein [Providencia heimbachae]|uniref:hypothetical protein n=1 Tax=Providencia heimbachae TaxID=333962 RepID=UPI000838AC60|nr:hypothetical protein [Providencia heimbachae]